MIFVQYSVYIPVVISYLLVRELERRMQLAFLRAHTPNREAQLFCFGMGMFK